MKQLIIAEKPSVAGDIAKALGGFKKNGNFYESDDRVIAAAVGHIVELYMPDDIDKKYKWWTLKTLPIIPEKFEVKPIEKAKDKLDELKRLLKRKDIEEIVNGCDAGREGELIFAYIYQIAKCKKPVKRLWMSSMTKEGICEAFRDLKDGQEMLPLENAARCRSESDWLIGINGTRVMTTRMFGQRGRQVATVGRVQTPTLTLVYEREKAIRNFKPRAYWRILGEFSIQSGNYDGVFQKPDFKKNDDENDRIDRIWDKEEAEKILKAVQAANQGTVTEEKKRSKQSPPLLYDLTTLQREANSRFGMPAGITLKIAQSLYEKHKLITYPRTDSKALPQDYGPVCDRTLAILSGDLQPHAQTVLSNSWVDPTNKRIFNNKKVSDHFAIIPTDQPIKKLSEDEFKIYMMIARRFIAAFFPAAEYDVTTRMTDVASHIFKTEGKVLVKPGWLAVHGKAAEGADNLAPLTDADGSPAKANIAETTLEEDTTKPPPRYSEATLLGAMEHAGKLVDDEDLADAMKGKGLGTPATRAQTIEHLIREKYLEREQRELIPTVKAENLIEFLKVVGVEFLTSPALTGEWEHQLHQIENGELTREQFMSSIAKTTEQMVEQTRNFDEDSLDKEEVDIISPTDGKKMQATFRSIRSQDGELVVYKTMGNRKLSDEEIKTILAEGKIGPLDGFKSKAGKPFSAMLKFDPEEKKVKFDFGTGAGEDGEAEDIDFSQFQTICKCPMAEKGKCGESAGNVYVLPGAYQCENHGKDGKKCKFRISRTLLSRSIPEDQFLKLVNEGKTDLLEKFKSNRTKRFFSAHLILKDDGSIGFEFAKKAPAKKKTAKKKTAKKKVAKSSE